MKTVRVVAAAIIRNGVLFAAQRGAGMSNEGAWEFPGGKIEPNETEKEALIREISEELAVRVQVGPLIATTRHENLEISLFECTIVSGEIQLLEHSDARWIGSSEFLIPAWSPSDVALVDAARVHFTGRLVPHNPRK